MRPESEKREEYKDFLSRKRKKFVADPMQKKRLGREAQISDNVKSSGVTQEWEWLIAELETMRHTCAVSRGAIFEQLADPKTQIDVATHIRQRLLSENAQIMLLDRLLELPAKLIERGKKAREDLFVAKDSA